jgi:tetratricopeptide (TPR) repeat protein
MGKDLASEQDKPSSISRQVLLERTEFLTWRALSEQVQTMRHYGQSSALNEALLAQAKKSEAWQVAPAFMLWAGDNFMHDWRFDEAIDVYHTLIQSYAGRSFLEVEFERVALERLATAQARLGKVEDALDTYMLLAKKFTKRSAWAYYEAGGIAEHAGRVSDAIKAYDLCLSQPQSNDLNGVSIQELASRARTRLNGGNQFFPNPEELATRLARALRAKHLGTLRALASPTHFTIGIAGGHREFFEREKVLGFLENDLSASAPRCDHAALTGGGGKRYLHTLGWEGDSFRDPVTFQLTRSSLGWEWSGIILGYLTEAWFSYLEPVKKETNQPLAVSIKAPWPAGENFTAGGLLPYLAEQGSIVALAESLRWLPGIGGSLAATAMAGITLGLAGRDCGFGPGGFYYNFGRTHQGQNAFAIDFTRYQRFVPYHNIAGSSTVLACYPGVVTEVRDQNTSGDPSPAHFNSVNIDHVQVDIFAHPPLILTPYRSKSVHLQGPFRVPVSEAMYVRQGARLGVIDDTGDSAFDHLHFSIHDMVAMSGMSVKPTPMDGQDLTESDTGRCISSTNVPFP